MLAAPREDVRALNKLARATMDERPDTRRRWRAVQAGDHVMTLRNNRRLDVRNGERGIVQEISVDRPSMMVQMTDRVGRAPSSYLEAGHVSHGYAMTVHKAQCVTADRAFVLGTDDLYREMGYVAMSRGRLGNHLHVLGEPTRVIEPVHGPSLERTNEELLVAALSISRAQELASAQINPLADTPHVALVAERNDLERWLRSLLNDLAPRIARLTEQIDAHQDRIATLEAQQAAERGTRRSVRYVLARHDERGRATGYKIDGERHFLTQAIERRDELSDKQVLRDAMIAERGDVGDRLALVEAEIERRVGIKIDLALASPGEYLTRELGERPDDPELGEVWREGVELSNGSASSTTSHTCGLLHLGDDVPCSVLPEKINAGFDCEHCSLIERSSAVGWGPHANLDLDETGVTQPSGDRRWEQRVGSRNLVIERRAVRFGRG